MKKSIFMVLFMGIICSCSTSIGQIEKPIEPVVEFNSSEKTIEDALSDMYVFWEATFGKEETRGRENARPSIESIDKCTTITTKGGKDEIETVAYVVNFKDDAGFSILSAKKGCRAVIALTDNGSIEISKLQSALGEQEYNIDNSTITKELFEKAPIIDSPDYFYSFLAESIMESINNEIEVISTKIDDYPWTEVLYTQSPLVLTKWGQKYPFNKSMKYWLFEPYNDEYRKRSPVGCGIIAAAQFMMVVNHPAFNTLVSGYSWSDFSDLCRFNNYASFLYFNYDNYATDSQKTRMTKLAKGLSIIADEFNAECQRDITLVDIGDVVDGLKNMDSYYINASIRYPTLSMATLINMLDNGKPTYFRGVAPSSGTGHAWVVDGYIIAKDHYSETVTVEYPCLHFNWGYYGKNDGYYSMDSFLVDNRFSRDNTIDNSGIDYNLSEDFHNYRMFISY